MAPRNPNRRRDNLVNYLILIILAAGGLFALFAVVKHEATPRTEQGTIVQEQPS